MKREVAVSKPKSCKDLSLQQTVISVEYVRQPGDSKYWAIMQSTHRLNNPFKQGSVFGKRMHSAFGSFLTFRHGTAHSCVYAVGRLCKSAILALLQRCKQDKKSTKLPGFFPHLVWEEFGFYSGERWNARMSVQNFLCHIYYSMPKVDNGVKF